MLFYKEIEWEILQDEKIFNDEYYNFEFPFPMPHIKSIKIKRDEFYNLTVEINIISDEKLPYDIRTTHNIDFIKIQDKYSSEEYLLENCYNLRYKSFFEYDKQHATIFSSVLKVTFNKSTDENTGWIKEWYLNGPTDEFIFQRSIKYTKKEVYGKKFDKDITELIPSKFKIETFEKSYTKCRNFLFCKLNNEENIIIKLVPEELGPKWSNCISINYNSKNLISNNNHRRSIEAIISFIFGRKLIKIAESYYNSNGEKIKEEIFNPTIDETFNIKNICKIDYLFPIYFNPNFREKTELIISNIINSFINKIDKLDFSSMLTNYFNSLYLPPESEIILLAASLESITNKWLKSENSKRKTTILDKSEYKHKIKEIRLLFLDKFSEHKPLVDKFNELNKLSTNKSFERFFDEIGMEIGDIEHEAIQSRNNPVHGNDINTEDYLDLIVCANVYRIILNRVILLLLNFDGEYVIDKMNHTSIYNKIPYSLEEMRDDIYKLESYTIE